MQGCRIFRVGVLRTLSSEVSVHPVKACQRSNGTRSSCHIVGRVRFPHRCNAHPRGYRYRLRHQHNGPTLPRTGRPAAGHFPLLMYRPPRSLPSIRTPSSWPTNTNDDQNTEFRAMTENPPAGTGMMILRSGHRQNTFRVRHSNRTSRTEYGKRAGRPFGSRQY